MYLKQQQRKGKLEGRWCPYYRIREKTSPVIFHLKNQLNGSVTKAHAEDIRLANWIIPKDRKGRLTRRARLIAPLSSSSDEVDNELSDDEWLCQNLLRNTEEKGKLLLIKIIYL